ncbi:MAG TPA: zinc metalloprotease HtpX [Thermoplasmata archaeon]|nr:zinc metalloprotease HtpX [Thermoplasmata archaeon]
MGSLGTLRRGSDLTIFLVFGILTLLLLAILGIVDVFVSGIDPLLGFFAVVALTVLFLIIQWAISPAIVRWAAHRREEVTPQNNPWLYRTVQELCAQAKVPTVRHIWVSDVADPNAFVFGRTVGSAELVVNRPLLEQLNQDEVRAVLAHEVGHLRHRDVTIMTWASAVPLLAYVVARGGFEILRGAGRVRGKGAGQAILVAIALAILSYCVYLITQLLVLYLSRTRESYADAYSGAATKDPHLLASALTKIAYGLSLARPDAEPSGLRAFCIGDPVKAREDYEDLRTRMQQYDLNRDGQIDQYELEKAVEAEKKSHWRRANELFATHPPTIDRILMLEEMEQEIHQSGGQLPANIYKFV